MYIMISADVYHMIYILIYNVVISDSLTLRIILCMRGYLCPQIIRGYSASPPLGPKKFQPKNRHKSQSAPESMGQNPVPCRTSK